MQKNYDENGLIFGKYLMTKDTWVITNRWKNFMYLLIGSEKAMLIDTGYGEGNIREVVESITDKPLMVVNTHGHFDHSGGNGNWEEAWASRESLEGIKTPFDEEQAVWQKNKQYPGYKVNFLNDGDIVDLGNRKIEIISIPAHNESSIAFLDFSTRMLFCGDEIESGQVLFFVRYNLQTIKENARAHKANMEKLLSRLSDFDLLCPSHNGTPLVAKPYIDDFVALSDDILNDKAIRTETMAGFGYPTHPEKMPFWSNYKNQVRVEHGLACFIYLEKDV